MRKIFNRPASGKLCLYFLLGFAIFFVQMNHFEVSAAAEKARHCATTFGIMAPLKVENFGQFQQQLEKVKDFGINNVTVDVWWGLAENDGDEQYDWCYYSQVFKKIKDAGLKIIPIMSFHKCGGGPGDNCDIPIPKWVYSHFETQGLLADDLKYKSETDKPQDDAIVPWATENEAVLEEYIEFMNAFEKEFGEDYKNEIIELNVSLGPTGELRYPAYNASDGWIYPQRGNFQAYSQLAQQNFRLWAIAKYKNLEGVNQAWNTSLTKVSDIRPPSDSAGDHLADLFVEQENYKKLPYGKDFIDWYNDSLAEHARRVIRATHQAFDEQMAKVPLGIKLTGVHWQINECSVHPRIAEITAGLVQTSLGNIYKEDYGKSYAYGYENILNTIQEVKDEIKREVVLYFTALEMGNDPCPESRSTGDKTSLAEALVFWISEGAEQRNITLKGENALSGDVNSDWNWGKIANAFQYGSYSGFTLLRIGEASDEVLTRYNKFIKEYGCPTNDDFDGLPRDVIFEPCPATESKPLTVRYQGFLKNEAKVMMHWSYDGWSGPVFNTAMEKQTDGSWTATITVPAQATKAVNSSFFNGADRWDNNNGKDYHVPVDIKVADFTVKRLGMDYTPEATTLAIWSPDTANVAVVVDGTEYPCLKVPDFDGYTDVYAAKVKGDLNLKEYQFRINGVSVRDPYGVMVKTLQDCLEPNSGNILNVNIILDTASILPEDGWLKRPELKEREDAILYEVHIRDFTINENSGISAEKKGKFEGMTQTGAVVFDGLKTGIDHLKELGITHVQILPFYDFATCMYNWGYDPLNYNVPEEQYASTPLDYKKRVSELKTMINEFHRQGIRVIMDVVYNHTYTKETFQGISQRFYTADDLSGCGNSINTADPMVRRFIRDSLEYLVSEYNIDGFRFDLMGIFHLEAVKEWSAYLHNKYPGRKLLIYGEPWDAAGTTGNDSRVCLGNIAAAANQHIGIFNPKFRDAIKGDLDGTGRGYMFNSTNSDNIFAIKVGSRGAIRYEKSMNPLQTWDQMFAYDPEQTINYISAHDNFCLWDKIKNCGEDNNYGRRIVRFGMGIILTSQGIPFIHAGDEILRTKMNQSCTQEQAKNSFNAPDECNIIRWDWKVENSELFQYFKDLIALRKDHPGFRMNTWDEINDWVHTDTPTDKIVVTQIDADKNGDAWDEILMVYNSGNEYQVDLPEGMWTKVFDINGQVYLPNLQDTASCEGTAVTVFAK